MTIPYSRAQRLDVIEDVVEHLRTKHDLDMSDAREIMSEPASVRWVPPQVEAGVPRERGALPMDPPDSDFADPAVKLVLTRLYEKLRLGPTDEAPDVRASDGRTQG